MIYKLRQNKSGGHFEAPAINLVIEALSWSDAKMTAGKHITLCDGSGLYAAYDACGCCPCCGHRWDTYDEDPCSPNDCLEDLAENGLEWMGVYNYALARADGSLLVAEDDGSLEELKSFLEKQEEPAKEAADA